MSISTFRIATLIFLFSPLFLYCQTTDDVPIENDLQEELKKFKNKEVTIIGYNNVGSIGNSCKQKAIKININGVAIDTCYSLKTRDLSEDINQNITDNEFYIELIKLNSDELINIQTELNAFDKDGCDENDKPYIFIISEKGKENTYGLKRFLSCYPKNVEGFMKNIEMLFN